jgi:isopenicillin-N N-acyltransferase-like protein
MTTNNTERYEHIIISGQPFERGLSYGKQTKSKIITNINYYKEPGVLPDWDIVQKYIRDNYLKSIEKYYPSGLLEIKGIAVGAGVPVEDIIVLNARYELLGWKKILGLVNGVERQSGDCTGGICLPKATKSGDVLLGQTWDNYQRVLDDDIAVLLEVRPDPSERIASFFMLSEAGQLGRTGMNAKGLGIEMFRNFF